MFRPDYKNKNNNINQRYKDYKQNVNNYKYKMNRKRKQQKN